MEELKINKSNIKNNIGIEFKNNNDYINYMQNLLEFLEAHNKNYTQKQYFKILELKEIIQNIKIEEA